MLTVYKASAGSGKTHKLTGEYLKLLYFSPYAYRHILAVTFTNKATDEMKSRIIEELYNLAAEKNSDYLTMLAAESKGTEAGVRKQAKQILVTILHDYAAFNISTIDRFFQQTMRAFTREIGLQGGYGIEMDQNMVLTEAVDNLLAGLEKSESKELLGWLLRFAEDKIENGGEWNLRREIMALSKEIFKENYKAFSKDVAADIEDKQALENYKDSLLSIIRSVENEVKRIGEKGLDIIGQYGLQPSDFKGGSRSAMLLFQKWANGDMKEPSATFAGFEDNVDGCFTKTMPESVKQMIVCAMADGLNDCIKSILAIFANLTAYNTAKEITRYYYTLGILTDISNQVAEYRQEKNILLIADTTELLNKIIGGSDAPFIYEKTGTRVENYMIDEFQDTSKMQWENFRPLLKESLSHANANLIVGDVKQSIYRFRNSDWTLLDSKVHQDFKEGELKTETLKDNWRSFANIVNFNNALFTITPSILQQQYNAQIESSSLDEDERSEFVSKICSAYDESEQLIPSSFDGKDGHVQISFIQEDDDTDWKEEALNRIPETLERLQDHNYMLKDIAILVRTNLEGAAVAEKLLTYREEHPSDVYKYDIISDDALFVNSSSAVRFIISLLRHLKAPDDKTNRRMAHFSYIAMTNSFTGDRNDFTEEESKAIRELSRLSLYEMTEGMYRLFSEVIPSDEQVFVQAFLDIISEFACKEKADIGSFLKWWDDAGCRRTIATPGEQNAVRIMTIHKSKGLGFKAVIIPFCDWEIDHKSMKQVILWCRPGVEPFNKLHLVPVRYSQALGNTIFANDYFKEKLHAFIDNLNTLYVALTRAKEELIVFAPRPKKADDGLSKAGSISDLLWMGLSEFDFNPEENVYELGAWWNTSSPKVKTDIKELAMGNLNSISSQSRLHLRLKGKELAFENEHRKMGIIKHDILSGIKTANDIDKAVCGYLLSGVINKYEAEELITRLKESLENNVVKSWYDGSGQVLNEIDILFDNGNSKRPDRIIIKDQKVTVVDYKFGKKEEPKYHKQVRSYMDLIKKIGYKDVEGYIWYVELDKIDGVNL